MTTCPDCAREHLGPACGMSFRDRLRTIRLDPRATPTSSRDYFDREAVAGVFGEDSREKMLEETKGYGYARTVGDRVYHRDRHTNEVKPMTEQEVERAYLGG